MAPESRISKAPLDCHNLAEELPPGNIIVVGYEPSGGEYHGHSYVLRYISPDKGCVIQMKSIQGAKEAPPVHSLYTRIVDISGDISRDVQQTTSEFRYVFEEAVERGKGFIVMKDDEPIENFDEMLF
jgi:hypothetical protein